ncbi:acetyltransferase [Pseudoalteromonas prydzensis]|uniref:acetyltransferase n=1 Tax=Pseudoalteromonas prydzensis TaxID=182141 RepID=UPI003704C328
MSNKPHLIIGGGGHASVLLDLLIQKNINVIGYVSPKPAVNKKLFSGLDWFNNDGDILKFNKSAITLVNGIGSLPYNELREKIYAEYKELGFSFATLISPNAIVSKFATLEEGVQVMNGAIIQTGTNVGYNSIVNTAAVIDHDCNIGHNNHIAPGVTISGQVTSKASVHFGTGASVIHAIDLNANVIIGAGAIITKNVDANTICYSARTIKKVRE